MKQVARSVVSRLQQDMSGEVEQCAASNGLMRAERNTPDKLLINFIPSSRWSQIAELICQAYTPGISNYVFAMLRCESTVHNVVRDTFLAFAEEGKTLDVEQYQRWLYRTARNKAMTYKRELTSPLVS